MDGTGMIYDRWILDPTGPLYTALLDTLIPAYDKPGRLMVLFIIEVGF